MKSYSYTERENDDKYMISGNTYTHFKSTEYVPVSQVGKRKGGWDGRRIISVILEDV